MPAIRKNFCVVLLTTLMCLPVLGQENGRLFIHLKNGFWGFADASGKVVIKPQFLSVKEFSEGLARVAVCSKEGLWRWGFIDRTGSIVIKPNFPETADFSEGFAAV